MSTQGKPPRSPRRIGKKGRIIGRCAGRAGPESKAGAAKRRGPWADRHGMAYAASSQAAHEDATAAATRQRFWQPTRHLSAAVNAMHHWRKHGAALPEFVNAVQYVRAVNAFLRRPPRGTLVKVRPNGDRLHYHPARNLLGVLSGQGLPRTLFRPRSGIDYWHGL